MSATTDSPTFCPQCGGRLDKPHDAAVSAERLDQPLRYDLENLAALANSERAYDETVKVRVTQEDIRKLLDKRKKKSQ